MSQNGNEYFYNFFVVTREKTQTKSLANYGERKFSAASIAILSLFFQIAKEKCYTNEIVWQTNNP